MNGNAEARSIARQTYEAYIAKDRQALEAIVADEFRFTSPQDNRIDRATYFARCWPGSQAMKDISIVAMAQDGDRVFVTYDARMMDGRAFRNTELLTIRDGKLVEAQVFFGWTLPHEAQEGGFL
jgi:ketosteroid isomerase-like protein